MRKIILLSLSCLMTFVFVNAQTDTTINGVSYTLFSPGLWVEIVWAPGYVHCGYPTEIVEVTNPVTGETWMDRNLGASRVATSPADEQSYGSLFQWGRGADGHQCVNRYTGDGVTTSETTSTLSSIDQPGHGDFILVPNIPRNWRSPQEDDLWQGVNGVNNPCPSGYRLPTTAELNAERLSWSSNNRLGAFASPLKLPSAGSRSYSDGSFLWVDILGFYWSSTVSSVNSLRLLFTSSDADMNVLNRASGLSVRCLKD